MTSLREEYARYSRDFGMRRTVILAFTAATLLGAGYFANEALARGGGGGGGRGGHGGMSSGWHGPAMHGGAQHMRGQMRHFSFKGQHSHGMQNFGQHNMHHNSLAQGQWHSVPGFGGQGNKWANMPGVWHKGPGFGSRGQANNTRRDWQAGGGGWVAAGSVGDICVNATMCQGVWQVAPQRTSRASQSRSNKRDWQVGEEL